MRLFACATLACYLLLAVADSVRAGPIPVGASAPITVDGGWQSFSWANGPGVFNAEGALTFTSTQATKLTVTDAFVDGDRFQVFDNGTSLGLTSVPANDGFNIGQDPDKALTDPRFSSGVFSLAPGAHAITLKTIAVATGDPSGGGSLRVDTVVTPSPSQTPEPAGMTLMALAGACMAGYCWRRVRKPGQTSD
jgi:hypothetical protein